VGEPVTSGLPDGVVGVARFGGDALVELGVQVAELVHHGGLGLAADLAPLALAVAGVAERELAAPQLTGSAGFAHPTGAASVVGIGEGGLAVFVERADAFDAIGMDGRAPVCLHHDRDGLLDRLALTHPDRLLDGLYCGG
jgi:hypothetical protein